MEELLKRVLCALFDSVIECWCQKVIWSAILTLLLIIINADTNAVVTPLHKAASYEQRKTNLGSPRN